MQPLCSLRYSLHSCFSYRLILPVTSVPFPSFCLFGFSLLLHLWLHSFKLESLSFSRHLLLSPPPPPQLAFVAISFSFSIFTFHWYSSFHALASCCFTFCSVSFPSFFLSLAWCLWFLCLICHYRHMSSNTSHFPPGLQANLNQILRETRRQRDRVKNNRQLVKMRKKKLIR